MICHKKPDGLTAQELDAVMQIWLVANQEAHSFIVASYFLDAYEAVKKLIPKADIWLYKKPDDQIIGFAGVVDGYLAGLFVKASARGNGVGVKLVQACIQAAGTLRLHVYEKNTGAVRFYENVGFEIVAKRINQETQEMEYEMQIVGKD